MRRLLPLLFPLLAAGRPMAGMAQQTADTSRNGAEINVAGRWTGTHVQIDNRENFRMRLDIEQAGSQLSGKSSYISEDGSTLNVFFTGTLKGNQFDFVEKRVERTRTSMRDKSQVWCLGHGYGTLSRKGDTLILDGILESTGRVYDQGRYRRLTCPDGTFRLTKRVGKPLSEPEPKPLPRQDSAIAAKAVLPAKPEPKALEQTEVKIVQTFEAAGEDVTIEYRDNLTVDGDIISLNMDGDNWIVQNSKLKRKYRKVSLPLTHANHSLILFAENAGNGGKNTATIRLTSGGVVKTYDMTSDAGVSQAIRIVRR